MNQNSVFQPLLLSIVLIALSGCTMFQQKDDSLLVGQSEKSWSERMPWSKSEDELPEPYPNPVKLAATWTPDTLTQTGRVPTRGFGARVFFYDEKSRPVPVEGTLVVHAFDEQVAGPDGQPTVKRYEFTPEQFTRHFSQSDLGASYSVWIPWDAIGGQQTRVSLVASFSTSEGKMVQGTPTTVLLPGAKDKSGTSLAERFAPEYRQWQAAAAGNTPPQSGLTTTTIHRNAPQPRATPALPDLNREKSSTWNVADTPPSSSGFEIQMRSPTKNSPTSLSVMPASSRVD